jgi:uncharacterized protein (DUF2147 family)
MTMFKTLAAAALLLGFAAPSFAADLTPVGTWQTTTGESRYAVNFCGDGTQLCAKLTWLRPDAQTPENLALLNKTVVSGAVPVAANSWKGRVQYDGRTVAGSVTLVSEDQMQLRGCQLVCKNVGLVRL